MLKVISIQINLWKEENKHTGKVDIVDSKGKSTQLCLDSATGKAIASLVLNFIKEKRIEQRTS